MNTFLNYLLDLFYLLTSPIRALRRWISWRIRGIKARLANLATHAVPDDDACYVWGFVADDDWIGVLVAVWPYLYLAVLYHAIYWVMYFGGFTMAGRLGDKLAAKWWELALIVPTDEVMRLARAIGRVNRLRLAIARAISPIKPPKITAFLL